VVNELVDEEPVAIFELRHHAGALNTDRLVKERDDEHRGNGREDEIAEPESQARRLGHDGRWRAHRRCRRKQLRVGG